MDRAAKEFFPQSITYLLRYFVPNIHGLTTWHYDFQVNIAKTIFFPSHPFMAFYDKRWSRVLLIYFGCCFCFSTIVVSHWWFCSTLNISKTINWDQSFAKVQNESIKRLWPLSALILRNWNLFHTTSFLLGFRIQAKPMYFFPMAIEGLRLFISFVGCQPVIVVFCYTPAKFNCPLS